MDLNDDVTTVFRGFLNLPNLHKLKLVETINEYFDSNDREPIRRRTKSDSIASGKKHLKMYANVAGPTRPV